MHKHLKYLAKIIFVPVLGFCSLVPHGDAFATYEGRMPGAKIVAAACDPLADPKDDANQTDQVDQYYPKRSCVGQNINRDNFKIKVAFDPNDPPGGGSYNVESKGALGLPANTNLSTIYYADSSTALTGLTSESCGGGVDYQRSCNTSGGWSYTEGQQVLYNSKPVYSTVPNYVKYPTSGSVQVSGSDLTYLKDCNGHAKGTTITYTNGGTVYDQNCAIVKDCHGNVVGGGNMWYNSPAGSTTCVQLTTPGTAINAVRADSTTTTTTGGLFLSKFSADYTDSQKSSIAEMQSTSLWMIAGQNTSFDGSDITFVNFEVTYSGDMACVYAYKTIPVQTKWLVTEQVPSTIDEVNNLPVSPDRSVSTPSALQVPIQVDLKNNCVRAPPPYVPLQSPSWGSLVSPVCTDYDTSGSQWIHPFTGVVIRCIEDTMMNIFVPNENSYYVNAQGEKVLPQTFFSTTQNKLKNAIRGLLALYIIFFGYKLMVGKEVPEQGQWMWLGMKFALVVYFAMGSGMTDLLPKLLSVSKNTAVIFMEAGFGQQNDAVDAAQADLGNLYSQLRDAQKSADAASLALTQLESKAATATDDAKDLQDQYNDLDDKRTKAYNDVQAALSNKNIKQNALSAIQASLATLKSNYDTSKAYYDMIYEGQTLANQAKQARETAAAANMFTVPSYPTAANQNATNNLNPGNDPSCFRTNSYATSCYAGRPGAGTASDLFYFIYVEYANRAYNSYNPFTKQTDPYRGPGFFDSASAAIAGQQYALKSPNDMVTLTKSAFLLKQALSDVVLWYGNQSDAWGLIDAYVNNMYDSAQAYMNSDWAKKSKNSVIPTDTQVNSAKAASVSAALTLCNAGGACYGIAGVPDGTYKSNSSLLAAQGEFDDANAAYMVALTKYNSLDTQANAIQVKLNETLNLAANSDSLIAAARTQLDALNQAVSDLQAQVAAKSAEVNEIVTAWNNQIKNDTGLGYNYCDFRNIDYKGQDDMKLWDMLDCKFSKYLGVGDNADNENVPQVLWISTLAIISSEYGIPIFIFTMIFLVFIIQIILKVVHTYIMAFMGLVMLVYVSPLIIPAVLFEKTKSLFETWLQQVMACVLQPIVLFACLSFMLNVVDIFVYGGNHNFVAVDSPVANRIASTPVATDKVTSACTASTNVNTFVNGLGVDSSTDYSSCATTLFNSSIASYTYTIGAAFGAKPSNTNSNTGLSASDTGEVCNNVSQINKLVGTSTSFPDCVSNLSSSSTLSDNDINNVCGNIVYDDTAAINTTINNNIANAMYNDDLACGHAIVSNTGSASPYACGDVQELSSSGISIPSTTDATDCASQVSIASSASSEALTDVNCDDKKALGCIYQTVQFSTVGVFDDVTTGGLHIFDATTVDLSSDRDWYVFLALLKLILVCFIIQVVFSSVEKMVAVSVEAMGAAGGSRLGSMSPVPSSGPAAILQTGGKMFGRVADVPFKGFSAVKNAREKMNAKRKDIRDFSRDVKDAGAARRTRKDTEKFVSQKAGAEKGHKDMISMAAKNSHKEMVELANKGDKKPLTPEAQSKLVAQQAAEKAHGIMKNTANFEDKKKPQTSSATQEDKKKPQAGGAPQTGGTTKPTVQRSGIKTTPPKTDGNKDA